MPPVDRINFFDIEDNAPPGQPPSAEIISVPAWISEAVPPPEIAPHDAPASVNGEIVPPEFADDALALRFSHHFAGALRYVDAWGRWMAWDGAVWRKDETLAVYDLVRRVCRAASSDARNPGLQTRLASGKTVAAVEKLARADRRHAATAQQWDADPWVLNTPGGVVDLRTGETRAHAADDHLTKSTAVAPGGDCPVWLEFLDQVTNSDRELIGYLQRVGGYALTGSIREHALFFAYGTGGNGKGTFLNIIQWIMGDYAVVSPSETFMARQGSAHLTELARLQGARLVVAQETSDGKSLDSARVASITGGDPITANFMRQDHFTFNPQFKLFISGNHKPGLQNVTQAMKRRFNMIPFDVEISKDKMDQELPEKLRAEAPGILRWLIDGCLWWQDKKLNSPVAVKVATDDYFEAEDAFSQWAEECCTKRPDDWAAVSELFKSWEKWAKAAGEFVGSQKRFSQALISRGFPAERINQQRAFRRIAVIVPPSRTEPEGDRL